jgi:integrase
LSYQKARLTPAAYARTKGIIEGHLKENFGSMRISEIRKVHVQKYVTDRSSEVSPASVTKELNCLKHLLGLALEWEVIPVNHARGVKGPKAPAGRVRYLQPTELRAVLESCPIWLRPIAGLLSFTGMRRSEALGLRWLDVDLKGNRIMLPQTKNRSGRTVWLNALALQVLDSIPRDGARSTDRVFPISDQVKPVNVSLAFLRACRKVSIADFRLHDLRHTAASWLRMQGADIGTVADLLGHKDLRMAKRYQHLSPDFLQSAVRGLDTAFRKELATLPGFEERVEGEQAKSEQGSDHDRVTIETLNSAELVQMRAS